MDRLIVELAALGFAADIVLDGKSAKDAIVMLVRTALRVDMRVRGTIAGVTHAIFTD